MTRPTSSQGCPPRFYPSFAQYQAWAERERVEVYPIEALPVSPVRTRLYLIHDLDRAEQRLRWLINQPASPEIEALQPPPSAIMAELWLQLDAEQASACIAAYENHRRRLRAELFEAQAWEHARLAEAPEEELALLSA